MDNLIFGSKHTENLIILVNRSFQSCKKTVPNQADTIAIFRSCLLPKMRRFVALEGRNTGY